MSGIARDNLMSSRRGPETLREMRPFDIGMAVAGAIVIATLLLVFAFVL